MKEQEPRLSERGPAWSRLYRWELLTFSLETVSLAAVLAGAAQSILRQPAAANKTKSKKKVVLPLFLGCVPSFNAILTALEDLAAFVLQAIEVPVYI